MVRPTAVWSLDHTASSTLSIAKDVFRAATTDNVQALALIACEKFGATLAMCPETNKKIEDLIIKVSGPKLVRFMSAQIGYSANDCATQLSQSLAGVQFLGLAAALVSSVGTFQGANALSALVMASASDKTLVPTARQLKDLLGALEHRVIRSGFTDTWVGYRILLTGSFAAFHEQNPEPFVTMTDFMQYPVTEGVLKLVEAFRELDRLGNVIAITIHATSCAPWVMAFTRWCLGIPPSTYSPDGKALLDQVDSRITLFTSNDTKSSAFEISIQRSVGSPADLLKYQSFSGSTFGMISLKYLGQMWCQEMGGERSDEYKAMSEALPYALKQVYVLLRLEYFGGYDTSSSLQPEQRARLAAQPFPRESAISNILTRVLNLECQRSLKGLSEGCLISDLSLVRVHLRRLAETCACTACRLMRQTPAKSSRGKQHQDPEDDCTRENYFFMKISHYVADILALSLFENPETLLVLHGRGKDVFSSYTEFPRAVKLIIKEFPRAVKLIIKSGDPAACGTVDILNWALALVGHEGFRWGLDSLEGNGWIISCSKGQAVYPKVFETQKICQPGYLVLYWAPGLLFFNGESYDRGVGPRRYVRSTDVMRIQHLDVTGPLNLTPKMKTEWKVICCEGYLEIQLVCDKTIRNAFETLLNLDTSLILRGCSHDSASSLERPDRFANYTELCSSVLGDVPSSSTLKKEHIVDVLAVDGDAGLRMFAMGCSFIFPRSQTKDFVIRDNSCLQCCLDLCRKAGCSVVVC